VESFGKWLQVQSVDRAGLASIRETVAVVAEAEGLTAHRRAVDIRFEEVEA
jgi:histidinol dehydrogenase